MKKIMGMLVLLVGLLFTGNQFASAESIKPVEGDKYYPYVEKYLEDDTEGVEYVFIRTKWMEDHWNNYLSKYNEKDLAKIKDKDYVFANYKVNENGKHVGFTNEYVPQKLWKKKFKGMPKEGQDYISVIKISYDTFPRTQERIDIIEINGKVDKDESEESKSDKNCKVKFKKSINGGFKKIEVCEE